MTSFQIGEKVVYPNHGIGTIENISTRPSGNGQEKFYLLRLNFTSMTVLVPFSHAGDVGLRRVTKNCDVTRMLTFLAEGVCSAACDWKDRFKENSDKMRDGSMLSVAEVMKTLLLLQLEKPLSFREKKMLDRARHMLITEVSTCRGIREADAAEMLRKALGKCFLNLPEPI